MTWAIVDILAISSAVCKKVTKDQLFKKFREKRRKIPDIISLYRKKKNIKMVTQRLMNSVKRRFNAAIKEVSDLLNENREIKEENVAVFIVCNENLEEQLQKHCKEFERFEETLEENEENEKILENYESVIMEASKLLNHLKGLIKGHQQMLEATQRENQRKAEVEKGKTREKQN